MRALYYRWLDWCVGMTGIGIKPEHREEVRALYRFPFYLGDLFAWGWRYWWRKVRDPWALRRHPGWIVFRCRKCQEPQAAPLWVFGPNDCVNWNGYSGCLCRFCGHTELQWEGMYYGESVSRLLAGWSVGAPRPADATAACPGG